MGAGDEHVLAAHLHQHGSAVRLGAAFGVVTHAGAAGGKPTGLHGVGGDHRRLGKDELAEHLEHGVRGQLVTPAGGHHRIDDDRDVRIVGDDLRDHRDVVGTAQHPELEGLNRHVLEDRPGLFGNKVGIDRQHVLHARRILDGECGDDGKGMAAHACQRHDVGLDAGATRGVGCGENENQRGIGIVAVYSH